MRYGILILILALLLSSCNMPPIGREEKLLKAPMMSQMQKEVYKGLEAVLDLSQMIYKYPQSGNHRSPFIFSDLDGDGVDEALVFFAYQDSPNEVVAKVLKQKEEKWVSFRDIQGKGSQVEFVEFAYLMDSELPNLVIGWGRGDQKEKTISVYALEGDNLRLQLEDSYFAYHILEQDSAPLAQLVTVQSRGEEFQAVLYGKDSRMLRPLNSLPLYEETSRILQLTVESPEGETPLLYLDEELGTESISYGTEILTIENDQLLTVVGSKEGSQPTEATPAWQAFEETFRKQLVRSTYLGGTQVMVPRIKDTATSDGSTEDDITLIEYMKWDGETFTVSRTAAENKDAGYLLFYPERWVGNVTLVKDLQRQSWSVHKNNPSGELGIELFRIRVYYAKDYMDEFAKDDVLLDTRGLFSYYGYIPETEEEPLAITAAEAKELFQLI